MCKAKEITNLKLKVRFVETKLDYPFNCYYCCFNSCKACYQVPCLSKERADGKNGFYELIND